MDVQYQRHLIAAQFGELQHRIREQSMNIAAERVEDFIFARMYGREGSAEPYVVRISAGYYPVQPWRAGFVNPAVEGDDRLHIPDHDPRFWPFSGLPGLDGGFHVAFQGPFRVFICRPFTTEYFYYHHDHRWQPHVFDLSRVVMELDRELKKAQHFSKWLPLVQMGPQ